MRTAAKQAMMMGRTTERTKLLMYACLWVSFVVERAVMTPAL